MKNDINNKEIDKLREINNNNFIYGYNRRGVKIKKIRNNSNQQKKS